MKKRFMRILAEALLVYLAVFILVALFGWADAPALPPISAQGATEQELAKP